MSQFELVPTPRPFSAGVCHLGPVGAEHPGSSLGGSADTNLF